MDIEDILKKTTDIVKLTKVSELLGEILKSVELMNEIHKKLRFSQQLTTEQIDTYIKPIYNDFLEFLERLENLDLININTNDFKKHLKASCEDLLIPKFLKSELKSLEDIESLMLTAQRLYKDIYTNCIGILNNSMITEHFPILNSDDYNTILPEKMAIYALTGRNLDYLSYELPKIVKKKVSQDIVLSKNTTVDQLINIENRINSVVHSTMNKIRIKITNKYSLPTLLDKKQINKDKTREQLLEQSANLFLLYSYELSQLIVSYKEQMQDFVEKHLK